MEYFASTHDVFDTLNQNAQGATERLFNAHSLGLLFVVLALAFIWGRLIAMVLRRLNLFFSQQADKATYLPTVERWRRAETIVVISIALIRTFLFAFAIYLWWIIIHPEQQPTAIIGASAIFAIIAGGVFGPVLRDLASGSMMMTEHWFGVGDHVKIEPFAEMQGVVERVTLRSTRIRGLNGEVIWVNNQNIQAVRVATKGIRTIAIELFVSDLEHGQKLVQETDLRLPSGPLMVVSPLRIMSINQVANTMWHITAVGETAPGREWLLEKYAIEVLQELNAKHKQSILRSEPISRNADSEAEKKFGRAFKNASKISAKPSVAKQLQAARRQRTQKREQDSSKK